MAVVVDWGKWRIAHVSKPKIKDIIKLLEDKQIDGLSLNDYHGFDGDISILNDLPPYQGLVVLDSRLIDCQALPRLNELRFLSFGDKQSQAVDFSAIPNLEEYRGDWHPKDILPSASSSLRHLALWGYKPKSRDLTEFPAYEHLAELALYQTRIESVEGVQRFRKLRKFEAAYCRVLTNVAALVDSPVETVEFEACGQIQDVPALKKCERLKRLGANGCGRLESLNFLNESKSIESISFVNTNVEDGDMTPLFRLNFAGFMNKRSYSHTSEQVEEIIAKRLSTTDGKSDH